MKSQCELRAMFAQALSTMYGGEVPAYTTLVEVSGEVNADVLRRDGASATRLGSIDRVTAERHGAIRVGTPKELGEVARVFAALGMHPVGFYDLRDAAPTPVPVVATAFRPIDPAELAINPFRVFTSLLASFDERFFPQPLRRELHDRLGQRRLFSPELLALADRAASERRLDDVRADRFLDLAVGAFRLSDEPVDHPWHNALDAVSSVAADIGGVATTHVNHLTPRVLDIDELYRRMVSRGIAMIDEIQGPPRWNGPDVLLRQTSFRALAEPRRFREADGSVTAGSLRVRFGEVESRGIALTPAGRDLYDQLLLEVDRRVAAGTRRSDAAAAVWSEQMPVTEAELERRGLGFFTYRPACPRPAGRPPEGGLESLLRAHWVQAEPIVYEDFLPRSAAGIFQSNLDSDNTPGAAAASDGRDIQWLSGVLERDIADPMRVCELQRQASLRDLANALDRDIDTLSPEGAS